MLAKTLIVFLFTAFGYAESREEIIKSWQQIRETSLTNKAKACSDLQNAGWVKKFKHQDIIQFKLSDYCKVPPDVDKNNPEGLLKLAQFYRSEFQPLEAEKLVKSALKLKPSKNLRILLLEEQLKLDQIFQNKKSRLSTLKSLSLLDSEKYSIDYARILWTYSQTKSALAVLARADKKWKKSVSRQYLYFIQGRILDEQNKTSQALKLFEKALKEKAEDSDVLKNLINFYSWKLYRTNKLTKSLEVLEKFTATSTDRFTFVRAQFWMAKIHQKLKREEKAKEIWNQIIQEDPLSYYSALSHFELKKPFQPFQFAKNLKVTSIKDHSKIDSDAADKWRWSEDFSEKVFQESFISNYTNNFYEQKEKDQRILIENMWQAGLTNALTYLLSSAPIEKRQAAYDSYTPFLFPTPYLEQIKAQSLELKLEPSLVLSLIRQESGFNPMARSRTDALGLMQVMPKVARKIAKDSKITFKEDTELFDTELNLKIGTRELQNRLKEFKGNLVLAIASYNAGSDPVQGWKKRRKNKNILEFIEEIPYEETRSYVRLILRNQIIYKRIDSSTEFFFPEEWLKPI